MDPDFALTTPELLFLIGAVVVTIPMLIFVRFILRELRKEAPRDPQQ